MGTAHAPGVIEMGERALDHLAASRPRAGPGLRRSADGFAYNCCDPQYSIRPGILRASRSFV
jgi:hypothetical protein